MVLFKNCAACFKSAKVTSESAAFGVCWSGGAISCISVVQINHQFPFFPIA
jgi:hypothetical protein